MNNKRRFVITMLLSLVITMIFGIKNYASSKPLAELYFASHGAVNGLTALNSSTYKSETKTAFSSAGYNASAYTKAPAGPRNEASIIRTLDDDAIALLNMHAGRGRMVCVDSSNDITKLSAKTVNGDSSNYSLQYNFEDTTDKLKTVRLIVFWGCNTYGSDSKYGNLTTKAAELGVDCVITHSGKTYTPYCAYFTWQLAKFLNKKYKVSTALSKARQASFEKYGGQNDTSSNRYIAVSNYKVGGANSNPGNMKMKPAAYGVY